MSTVTVTPIKTALDYQNALNRIDELLILAPAPYSELDDELDVISTLVQAYEQTHNAIPNPDPIDERKRCKTATSPQVCSRPFSLG